MEGNEYVSYQDLIDKPRTSAVGKGEMIFLKECVNNFEMLKMIDTLSENQILEKLDAAKKQDVRNEGLYELKITRLKYVVSSYYKLEEMEKMILYKKYILRVSISELATSLNIAERTLRNNLRRIHIKLACMMNLEQPIKVLR